MIKKIKEAVHPIVFASMLLGALIGGYSISVSAQTWRCLQPKITHLDDNCTCEIRGCVPSKSSIEDPFMVCDYVPQNCPSDFRCPPLDACTKNSLDIE